MKLGRVLVFALFIGYGALLMTYSNNEDPLWMILALSPLLCLVGFAIVGRYQPWFKPILLSKHNQMSEKVIIVREFDFEADLLFDKLLEVLPEAGFDLRYANREKMEILASTRLTFRSWGENLYIDIEAKGENCTMTFTSTTFFQIHTWGKNKKNVEQFVREFENSLII